MKHEENIAFWNRQALDISDDDQVTHPDVFQKRLELDYLSNHLNPEMRVLEAGCGNGFVTEFLYDRVAGVDAFDASEEMVKRARKRVPGKKVSFFVKALPSPSPEGLRQHYDAVLALRVLINLENRDKQARAMDWIANRLNPGGLFFLLEGIQDGLDHLNTLRVPIGLKPLEPAAHNLNLTREWIEKTAAPYFDIIHESGIGTYDFLTRFYYPLVVGGENAVYNTTFHESAYRACQIMEDKSLAPCSRMLMMTLKRR